VHRLAPGHYLVARGGEVLVRAYWDLQYQPESGPQRFEEAVEELQGLLRETVRDHMMSDVPVGVLLSGGVDSTGVLRYAVEATNQPMRTFTVGFSEPNFADERYYAQVASRKYGTQHAEITVSAEEFRDFLPRYVWHMEDPICEPPAIALYYVSKLARESVKVVLSGEGGDEAFGGYQTYRNLLLLERLKRGFGPAKNLLGGGLKAAGRITRKNLGRYADLVGLSPEEYYFSRTASPFTWFNRNRGELYRPEFGKELNGHAPFELSRELFGKQKGGAFLNQLLYVDTKTWLPDDLLIKADKITMANSLELRVPLLDHKVLEFAASLPPAHKVRGFTLKRVLKAALRESVPEEILTRKKTGFPVPYERWLRNELHEMVGDHLLSGSSAVSAYFRPEGVRQLLRENERAGSYAKEVFCLLVLELWHRQFFGAEESKAAVASRAVEPCCPR
jgi:asparagine synthase (glutamine-hydrolysing)